MDASPRVSRKETIVDVERAWVLNVRRVPIPVPHLSLSPRFLVVARLLPQVLLVTWVVTLPFEFTKIYFPNQAFEVSRIVLVLCLVAFAIQLAFERRDLQVPLSASTIGLTLFTVYAAVSAALAGSVLGTRTAAAMVAYLLMMIA